MNALGEQRRRKDWGGEKKKKKNERNVGKHNEGEEGKGKKDEWVRKRRKKLDGFDNRKNVRNKRIVKIKRGGNWDFKGKENMDSKKGRESSMK